jgi:hypothetical protein
MKVKLRGKRVLTVEHGPYMMNDNAERNRLPVELLLVCQSSVGAVP